MSACSSSIPTYYYRDTTRAKEIQLEIHFVYVVICDAFEIAREVVRNADKLQKAAKVTINPKNIPFKITKEFLLRIVGKSAEYARLDGYPLTKEHVDRVSAFFREEALSSYYFINPHKSRGLDDSKISPVSTPLQILYRQQNDWFKKIDLPKTRRVVSSFDFVLTKAGFDRAEVDKFFIDASKINDESTFDDYLDFIEFKKMKRAALPFQEGDIIIYYDKDDKIMHAALVAKNTNQVFSKFGNTIEFAYRHHVDETPIMYGEKFRIYRK